VNVATCPGLEQPGPNLDLDYLDFPTAWALTREGLLHTDRRCSYVQTWGGLLCDCGAVEREWARRRASMP
jgi:hypothetical protein